jgi:hypothetical protein
MATFMANIGNLVQHWTTCEIATALRDALPVAVLTYCDAHAMAPMSNATWDVDRGDFSRVARNLAVPLGGSPSVYEKSWLALSPNGIPYPSSAVFVRDIWKTDVHLILCEDNLDTQKEIDEWVRDNQLQGVADIRHGRWQDRLTLPAKADCVYLQFDPYAIHTIPGTSQDNSGVMYPEDYATLSRIMNGTTAPMMIQITSYRANVSLDDLLRWNCKTFAAMNLNFECAVRGPMGVLSMMFSRDLKLKGLGDELGSRLNGWAKRRELWKPYDYGGMK